MKHIKKFDKINEAGITRVSLNEDDFRKLVSGQVVDTSDNPHAGCSVQIALQDIGYKRMVEILAEVIGK